MSRRMRQCKGKRPGGSQCSRKTEDESGLCVSHRPGRVQVVRIERYGETYELTGLPNREDAIVRWDNAAGSWVADIFDSNETDIRQAHIDSRPFLSLKDALNALLPQSIGVV